MADKPRPLQPRTPPRPRPPLGQKAPSLGKDVPREPSLARAPVIRSGAIVITAVWDE
ncbi:MAG: hypothetical protein ACUVV3_10015 [Dehalococcoidia bacterium]